MPERRAVLAIVCLHVLVGGSIACGATESSVPERASGVDGAADAGGTEQVDGSEDAGGRSNALALSACLYIGGLDRVIVHAESPARDLCVTVRIVTPASGGTPNFGIATPSEWAVEQAWSVATSCSAASGDAAPVFASRGTGKVTFDAVGPYGHPSRVSIHAKLELESDAGIPRSIALDADGLDVAGACP